MGRFVILDVDGCEVAKAGRYYGVGLTSNKAEIFVLCYSLHFLTKLACHKSSL